MIAFVLLTLALVAALLIQAARVDLYQRRLQTLDGHYHYIASPNVDDRPYGTTIDCVVLHSTAEPTLRSTIETFQDAQSQVSAHFVVGKDGTTVLMVPLERRAWHAGVSALDDRPNVNDYSVGIEMVNLNDGVDPYTNAQYLAVAQIIRRLRTVCDIPDNHIVAHAQIALPPGRKTDPKNFDWHRLRRLLHNQELS